MAMTKWGRNETFIWPPHSPIYTYGAVFMAVILTGLFVYCRFTFGNDPLQRFQGHNDFRCTWVHLLNPGKYGNFEGYRTRHF